MKEIQMQRGALKLLTECCSVQADDEVLIVSDFNMERIGRVLASVAYQIGCRPILTYIVPRERDGQEPPVSVAKAMQEAQVFLAPVSRSITHTTAVKEAIQAGSRGLMLTQFREEMLISGGIDADFRRIAPACESLAERFRRGHTLRLTTERGTDLTMSISGRIGNSLTCIVGPGQFSPVPNVEANVSPVEGTAQGRLIVDASIPYIGIGVLNEPVEMRIEEGSIVLIRGGSQAKRLEENLEGFQDKLVYNIAEIGIGLNPCARMTGFMLDDEGVLKTAHIGIGTNITLGGTIKASCHYDLLLWNPTVEIDGRNLIEKGDLLIPERDLLRATLP